MERWRPLLGAARRSLSTAGRKSLWTEAIQSNQKRSKAIRSNPKQSEAIRSEQKQSRMDLACSNSRTPEGTKRRIEPMSSSWAQRQGKGERGGPREGEEGRPREDWEGWAKGG